MRPFISSQSGWARSAICGAFALTVLLPLTAHGSAPADAPPAGHSRQLSVMSTEAAPRIDGKLDDEAWSRAPVASGFWVSEYQQAPTEWTEVRVVSDHKALYFAIMCHDARAAEIRADQTQRDQSMGRDDHVAIELDPFHNHRLISRFSVNARGTQADAMAGGRSRKAAWRGEWQAAVARTGDGWTAELAVPFEILDFDRAATVFGINFVRYHARTQELSRWADITPLHLSDQAGHLVDLQLPVVARNKRLVAMPYASGGFNTLDRGGDLRSATATTGMDLRLDVGRSLGGVVTLNPDFSHVEDAVVDVGFAYNEKFRRDPRPFFQDGSAFFGNRTYFHSGRVEDFRVGAKTFGKVGAYQVGAMALTEGIDGRHDYVGSVKRELGDTVNAGVTVVATDRADFSNGVIALQTNGRLGRNMTFGVDVAGTSTAGRDGDGTRAVVSFGYRAPYVQFGATLDQTDAEFFPANGFIAADTLGTRAVATHVAIGRGFGSGWLRRGDASVSFGARETFDGMLQRQDVSIYGSVQTRSNVSLSGGFTRGPYRPRATSGDEWLDFTYNDRFYTASASQYGANGRYGYGATYSWGFLADADYRDLAPHVWLKPTSQTSVNYSYERADYYGVSQQHVLSLSWDVTPENAVSGRWVQYGEPYYRVTYRRVVRQGIDVFAVFNHDPYRKRQFTTKLVWSMNLVSRSSSKTL